MLAMSSVRGRAVQRCKAVVTIFGGVNLGDSRQAAPGMKGNDEREQGACVVVCRCCEAKLDAQWYRVAILEQNNGTRHCL